MKITKTLIILLIGSLSIFSCKNEDTEKQEKEIVNSQEPVKTEKIEKMFSKFKSLYNELLEFKDNEDFRKFGFGEGGPYRSWLDQVEQLERDPDSKLLARKGVLATELKSLGKEYVTTKGEESEIAEHFNEAFSKAIDSKSKAETTSTNKEYERIKNEYDLFGEWIISNSNFDMSEPYEVYQKGNEFIGVFPEDDFKMEQLEKKGNKYYIKDSKAGEFYTIDDDKNMKLFDQKGDLSSVGYKATKK